MQAILKGYIAKGAVKKYSSWSAVRVLSQSLIRKGGDPNGTLDARGPLSPACVPATSYGDFQMASWDWKNDRRVQFAVGLAIVLVAAKWLFTGSLMSDIEVMQGQVTEQVMDEDGSLKSVPVPTSAGAISIAMDFLIGALVTIGAWVLNLGGTLFGKINSAVQPQVVPVVASPTAAIAVVETTQSDVIEYARATRGNDTEAIEKYRTRLRLPQVVDDLVTACQSGDFETADPLYTELKTLFQVQPVATKKRGGTNG